MFQFSGLCCTVNIASDRHGKVEALALDLPLCGPRLRSLGAFCFKYLPETRLPTAPTVEEASDSDGQLS